MHTSRGGAKKKVVLVELTVFQGILPLASGYLEAYACKNPVIKSSFEFTKYSTVVDTPYAELLSRLTKANADVYAFSCYVWNTGLVRRLLTALKASHPHAYFMLGGPQVINHGERYLDPAYERLVLCNGEGEKTFHGFLCEVLHEQPDFSRVNGMSFYRSGTLVTTEPEPRIKTLDEIPSPFLEGLFKEDEYMWAIIETNRGCPFKCNYCFWGAATGTKLNVFGDERVKEELAWLCKKGIWYLFIADANWGIRKRDVDLSRHLAECRKKHGAPRQVHFCGSKNTPETVAEITGIFHDANMVATQSISLQTMNPETLRSVQRDNIKTETYTILQQRLNEKGMSSFLEMIWPLPGETLASFKQGLSQLCELKADSLMVYPLLLINNVELKDRREEFGLVAVPDHETNSEAEIVVATNQVSQKEYIEGIRFIYAVTSLYCLRGLGCLGSYLHSTGKMTYEELFSSFVEYSGAHRDNAYVAFYESLIEKSEQSKFGTVGGILHTVLHSDRAGFDKLLKGFVAQHAWWQDKDARALFEIDLINRPYIYRNTPISTNGHDFQHVSIQETTTDGFVVKVPSEYRAIIEQRLMLSGSGSGNTFKVSYRRGQLPYMPHKPLAEHHSYCQAKLLEMRSILPTWTETGPAVIRDTTISRSEAAA